MIVRDDLLYKSPAPSAMIALCNEIADKGGWPDGCEIAWAVKSPDYRKRFIMFGDFKSQYEDYFILVMSKDMYESTMRESHEFR